MRRSVHTVLALACLQCLKAIAGPITTVTFWPSSSLSTSSTTYSTLSTTYTTISTTYITRTSTTWTSTPVFYQCKSGPKVLRGYKLCDGRENCPDGDDEEHCWPSSSTSTGTYTYTTSTGTYTYSTTTTTNTFPATTGDTSTKSTSFVTASTTSFDWNFILKHIVQATTEQSNKIDNSGFALHVNLYLVAVAMLMQECMRYMQIMT